jgi:hypothetical protein
MWPKPPVGSRVNRNHPLARGLVGCWLFNESGGNRVFDHARRLDIQLDEDVPTPADRPLWAPGRLVFDGVTSSIVWPSDGVDSLVSTGTQFTYYIILRPTNIAGGTTYQSIGSDNAGSGFYLKDDGKVALYNGVDNLNNTALTENRVYHYACAETPAGATFYLNGRADGTSAASGGFQLRVLGDSGGGDVFGGEVFAILLFNRSLSRREIEALYADPYAYMRRVDFDGSFANDPIEYLDVSGAVNISLSAAGIAQQLFNSGGAVDLSLAAGALSSQLIFNSSGEVSISFSTGGEAENIAVQSTFVDPPIAVSSDEGCPRSVPGAGTCNTVWSVHSVTGKRRVAVGGTVVYDPFEPFFVAGGGQFVTADGDDFYVSRA